MNYFVRVVRKNFENLIDRTKRGDVNEAVGILTNDSTPMGPVGMGPNLNQSTSAIDDLASLDIGTISCWVI